MDLTINNIQALSQTSVPFNAYNSLPGNGQNPVSLKTSFTPGLFSYLNKTWLYDRVVYETEMQFLR